ncbi:MAG TPA: peptidylprolyl isomerase [Bryobacteraceae bacterium]|nr:peptidylprolyl isomerase [Bryobacteraceae bacterium]
MTRRQALLLATAAVFAIVPTACGTTPKAAVRHVTAPAEYKVLLQTTKGDVVILVHREWSPLGADHFYTLIKSGYYNNNAFFRAMKNFVVQFGMNGDPKVTARWNAHPIKDDPSPKVPNKTGSVVFAKTSAPDSRTTHIFININDNSETLDATGFTPFGEVIQGLDNVMNLYMDYGDGPPSGAGPDQEALSSGGNAYLKAQFPKLDYIVKASIVAPAPAAAPAKPAVPTKTAAPAKPASPK